MAPRLVRRPPLVERIKAYLNPLDYMLWFLEELHMNDWEQWNKEWANPIGVFLNLVFSIARANFVYSTHKGLDDVFGEDIAHTPWMTWLTAFLVHFLSLLSFVNAAYTFHRQRRYRLFGSSVDTPLSTPSAQRVRVDSSPLALPLPRFLSTLLGGEHAGARSHSDATRDVWEIAIWDPTPFSLQLFCLFSPGHILVYWFLTPTTVSDRGPSKSVILTIALASLLSAQMLLLQSSFSRQSKDTSIIHKEVMNEYNYKYVHPRTQPEMRNVGTQYCTPGMTTHEIPQHNDENNSVDVYTPSFVINRGFHTRPSPNYAKHVDPDGSAWKVMSSDVSKNIATAVQTPARHWDVSSPIRSQTAILQPQFKTAGKGDGGSLGVFSHASSPLRKPASSRYVGLKGQRERSLSPVKVDSSQAKQSRSPPVPSAEPWGHLRRVGSRRESGRF